MGTKAYAQREGIAVCSLYYWRRRLKAQCHGPQLPTQSANATAARLFVPVSMDAGSVPVNRYILSLGCDLRLELPGLPSPQWLAQVSQALQGQAR
ncbi:IS66 family insertion sequence element accessory protein TnpA [Castellaniella defragrans]|uniref:IS66 family insertion sequence element accessory protein TnpA n=1 Tax=Castellaniella defragrans TaxID=75697 RepID=UPI00396AAC2D